VSRTADLVVTGPIATLAGGSGFGWLGGMAVADGAVIAVGTAEVVERLAGPATRRWRMPDDLCVLPGITDAHLHLGMAAREATQLDLHDAPDRGVMLTRIAAEHERMAAAGDERGWLEGHGWSIDRYGGWPNADDLQTVAPGRPVSLWSHDHHARWVSHAVLAMASIDPRADPGGLIRCDAQGRPTGVLHEDAAGLVDPLLPTWDRARHVAALDAYARRLVALGVTGVHDPGELDDEEGLDAGPGLYRALAREGGLPIRVTASVQAPQLPTAIDAGFRSGAGEGRYREGWLKLFSDGALGSRSAALLEPWEASDPAGPPVGDARGMLTMDTEASLGLARQAAGAGIGVQIHAIGDRAVRLTLDVLAATARVPGVDHRVEHAQLIDPTDVPRFARLGVAASVQPCHLWTDEPAMRVAWGGRTANAFPLAALDTAGSLMPFGTDAPVEPPDPWRGLAAAVARTDPAWAGERGPFHPGQVLPVARAMRAACLDPASVAGRQDLGRLVPGARADLIVVPLAGLLDPGARGERLAATRPLATLVDGEVAHLVTGFDPDA
jgi:predicted amidohydrolase YtcJ